MSQRHVVKVYGSVAESCDATTLTINQSETIGYKIAQ